MSRVGAALANARWLAELAAIDDENPSTSVDAVLQHLKGRFIGNAPAIVENIAVIRLIGLSEKSRPPLTPPIASVTWTIWPSA